MLYTLNHLADESAGTTAQKFEALKHSPHVVIAGSRSITDYFPFEKEMDFIMDVMFQGRIGTGVPVREEHEVINPVIISGTARGPDQLGEKWAGLRGFPVLRMPADWSKHGKKAGYIRNQKMVRTADAVVVFWDGESRGTRHTMNIAKEMDKPLYTLCWRSKHLLVKNQLQVDFLVNGTIAINNKVLNQ